MQSETKNNIYNEAINQMIQNGEVEEVANQPQIDKNGRMYKLSTTSWSLHIRPDIYQMSYSI